jgi:hypothetical protein
MTRWALRRDPWRHRLLIVLAGVALYVPFASRMLYHIDSVGFALAIHDFDLRQHIPQAPGYPLYVLALRAVSLLTGASDNATMVILGIAATIGTALLFFQLARSWAGPGEALLLACLLLSSPVVWFNAEIAMSYAPGMLSSVSVALAAFRLGEGSRPARYGVPLLWGLSTGLRPELGVILAPLVIYSSLGELRRSRGYRLAAPLLAALPVAAWLLPVLHLAGGPRFYLRALRIKSAESPLTYLYEGDVRTSLERVAENDLVGLTFLAIGLLGVLPIQCLWRVPFDPAAARRYRFLAAWALPGILLHSVAWVSHSGYVLPYLPALLLMLVPPVRASDRHGDGRPALVRPLLLAAGIAVQLAFFGFMPQQEGMLSGSWGRDTLRRSVALEPTRSRIQRYDATLQHLVAEIRSRFPPASTLLIAPVGEERPRHPPIRPLVAQGRYYLPAWEQRVLYTQQVAVFRPLSLPGNIIAKVKGGKFELVNTNVVLVPDGIRWLVWFCDAGAQPYPFDDTWTRRPLGDAVDLILAEWEPSAGRVLRWGPFEFRSGDGETGPGE